ncbi:MAG: glycosyltransferase, partial [Candidatus Paceibacterales bacterium]
MKIKKIVHVTNCRMPTERALGLVIVKLCERFASQGIKVDLVCPYRINRIREEPFDYYRVPKSFKIKKVFSLDLIPLLSKYGFWIQYISFSILSTLYLILKGEVFKRQTIFFSNDYLPLFFLSFFTKNVYYDVHRLLPYPSFYRLFLPRLSGIITTNKFMRSELIKKYQVSPKRVISFPNAIDLKEFRISSDKIKCREKFGLPKKKKLIFYIGQLFAWNMKGAITLAESSQFLPKNTEIYFVG